MAACGFSLSYIGSLSALEGLNFQVINIMPGETKEIFANLDIYTTNNGIYVVKVTDFGSVQITTLDPNGKKIDRNIIEWEYEREVERNFDIPISGTYKLLIENVGQNEAELSVAVGGLAPGMEIENWGNFIGFLGIIGILGTVFSVYVRLVLRFLTR